MSISQDDHCHLLELPPELRNRIHRFTLHEGDGIDVTAQGYTRPALLATCHRVRNEALSLLYLENDIKVIMNDFGISVYYRFRQSLRALLGEHLGVMRIENFCTSRQPNWASLLELLELFHGRKVQPRYTSPMELVGKANNTMEKMVMGGLFDMVEELRSVA